MQEMKIRSLGPKDPLEEEMATHSSILSWEIPWTEELGRLQSMVLQKSWVQLGKYTTINHELAVLLFSYPLSKSSSEDCIGHSI